MLEQLGSNGIGYAIASQLISQDKAKPVKLTITQTVLPDDALYPYAQSRGYAYRDLGSAAQSFLGFASTKPGQAAVAAAKREEAKAIAAGQPITLPESTKRILAPTAQPLSQLPELSGEPVVAPGVIVEQRPNFWWLLLALALFVALPIFWLLRRPRQPISSPSSPAVPPTVPPTTTVDPVRPSEPAYAATDLVASDWIEESVMAPTVVFQPASEPVSEQIEPEIITQVITSEFVESEQIEARPEQSEPEFVESEFTESEFTESEQVAQEFVEPELTPPSLLDETELVDADISDPEITSEQIEADLELAEDQAEPTDETVVEETSDLGIAEHPTSELTIPEPIPEPIVVTLPEVASLKVTPPLETQPTSLKQAWLTGHIWKIA